MLILEPSTRYKKDVKRIKKSKRLKECELKHVVTTLMNGKPLEAKYLDHKLSGDWDGYRECHVQNDILLVYKIERIKLLLTRLGTHSNIFG
ncbi:MAG TPA: type II toxin-antitoxin system YafQ family toxin [Gammaproteobacteria bacterium]|nr:type II toxin-antitoxin system YafQ family toxin [Gammaproteobacteria bacterium]